MSLAAEMPASKAAAEVARMTGGHKPDLYRRLLERRRRMRRQDNDEKPTGVVIAANGWLRSR